MAADSQKLNPMPLENYVVKALKSFPRNGLTGRRKILTPVKEITLANLRPVLEKTLAFHSFNAGEIEYLYRFYCGEQDIRNKKKVVRENINNKVTVNRANEIVTFKTAFALEEPVQYISHGGDDTVSEKVNRLNEYMRAAGSDRVNKSVFDWFHICGVGLKLALVADDQEDIGAPFEIYSVDPRKAFVIYHDGIGEKPLAGVILGVDENGDNMADVYTKDAHYVVDKNGERSVGNPQYGEVPLVEYLNNEARIGAFEVCVSQLNAINELESDAIDSVGISASGHQSGREIPVAAKGDSHPIIRAVRFTSRQPESALASL